MSRTWNVNEARPVPLALAAGVHVRLAMLAAVMTSPAVTVTPESFSVPFNGSVVMITDAKLLAGVSLGSVKPKSPVLKV